MLFVKLNGKQQEITFGDMHRDNIMKNFFKDDKGNLSMNRLISFGCYLSGSVIGLLSVFKGIPEGVVAGTTLAAIGIGMKTLQKKYENGK